MSSLEAGLARGVGVVRERVSAARAQAASAAASAAALDAKLARRHADLQRAEKRLHTVQKIKPAYQSELSALETEIAELWDQYVVRYRCVEALKHQLSLLERAQAEAAEEQQAAILQLIHKYEAEDVLGKLHDTDEEESSSESKDSSIHQPRPAARPRTRLRINTAGTRLGSARRAFGAMGSMGARDSLDDVRDEDDSRSASPSHSDSDMQLFGTPSPTLNSCFRCAKSNNGSGGAAGEGRETREGVSRWRPRPATRTLAAADDFADLIDDEEVSGAEAGAEAGAVNVAGGAGGRSSSSDSELRRADQLSDDEF
ncbi:Clusterin-associated protein 1-like [Papilio machaon]|uniref:Clusterin-associated protein 1-like n=1 Tax=Papilio machaon TaxID=76193 RepID=A0A0N1IBK7_PAPMA|nr:Clusterin-associated protein 1-like [Papilio machaon]